MATSIRERTTLPPSSAPGFRPSSRSRVRIATGVLLSTISIGVILVVFSTADQRVPVLQVVRDIPAGTQLTADMLRPIELSADPSLAVVPAVDANVVVGQYAKVRITAGGLLSPGQLQPSPLVGPGSAIVAVSVRSTELPSGLRERSRVQLVFPVQSNAVAPTPVTGRVVGLPADADSVTGDKSLSIEVSAADAVVVASQGDIRIVLLDPGIDPATEPQA